MSTCPQCGTPYAPEVSICAVDGTVLGRQDPAPDPVVGTLIDGKYRIDGVIGRGGMGAVYRATHVMLNKTVAVKTIKPDLIESTEMAQRFQREARAATSLEHPNIVAVYDLGQAEDGALYIAMEFVRGVDLKEAIRVSGPMPAARIVPLLAQVASALARAHRHHIVHRDLKPQNLMIATDGSTHERVKLLDFGIAKTLEDGATQLTAAGYALGTPHYMAPEQVVGQEVDGRADIYALGVILYEMLVGDVPFNAASAPAVLIKHLNEAPEPPSHRRPDLHIPPALEAIALRCLEKDPANRFQTAEEFGAALERSLPAGASADASVASAASTVLVPAERASAATAPGGTAMARPVAGVPDAPAVPSAPTSSAAAAPPAGPLAFEHAASAAAVPPPIPGNGPGTRPTIKAQQIAAAPASVPTAAGRGRAPFVAVLLGIAALFFVALSLGSYAAYRVWKSRSAITAESVSIEPAPASAPAMAPDTTTPVPPSASDGTERGEAAPVPAVPPPAAPAVPAGAPAPANPGNGARAAAPSGGASPRPAHGGQPQSAEQASSSAPDVAAAAEPVTPPLPKNPPVYFECGGPPDVCGAFTTAFEQALERADLPRAARPDDAELIVSARATLLDTREDQQFGTNFTVQTFSLELQAESGRDGTHISMPAQKTFSFDRRFGRERAAEQGRVMASEALERLQKFWTKRLGG